MKASEHTNRMPVREAARMFEVSEPVFRRMVRNGDLMFLGIFCSEGTFVIPRQAVVKYFAGERIEPKKPILPEPEPTPVRKPTREEAAEALEIVVGFLRWLPTQPHPVKKDAASPGGGEPTPDKETPDEPDQT